MEKKEEKRSKIIDAGIAGAATETVQRYGSAVKEHAVAYSGVDNETGQVLTRSLKSISRYKLNPDAKSQNVSQQAGFAAEVKTVAIERAEQLIQEGEARSVRTDDIPKQSDGKGGTVGGTNDKHLDIVEVDSSGKYIKGTGKQLKYVGKDPKKCYDKLLSKDYDKYRENGNPIEIPSDYYDEVQKLLTEQIESLEEQICSAEKRGDVSTLEKKRQFLEKVKKTQESLKKGKLTKREAEWTRKHPLLSTAKDMGKVAHRSGVQTAKSSAAIGGGISVVRNLVSLVKGEKEIDEAALDVAKDTGSAAIVGYGTGAVGATIKGLMQNSGSSSVRALSGTNLPGIIVTVALNSAKTLKKYYNAEIDGVECLEELGEQGTGMLSSAMFASLGAAIPKVLAISGTAAPIIGGLAGGMIGYAVAAACYGILVDSLKEAKVAREERLRIERECEEMIKLIREYRLEVEKTAGEYLTSHIEMFHSAFDGIKLSLAVGDVDGFITGANSISEMFGRDPQFCTKSEFDALMADDGALKI